METVGVEDGGASIVYVTDSRGLLAPSDELKSQPSVLGLVKTQPWLAAFCAADVEPAEAQAVRLVVTSKVRLPLEVAPTLTSGVAAASTPSVWTPLPSEFQVEAPVQSASMR